MLICMTFHIKAINLEQRFPVSNSLKEMFVAIANKQTQWYLENLCVSELWPYNYVIQSLEKQYFVSMLWQVAETNKLVLMSFCKLKKI